jgi:hypothetical protein
MNMQTWFRNAVLFMGILMLGLGLGLGLGMGMGMGLGLRWGRTHHRCGWTLTDRGGLHTGIRRRRTSQLCSSMRVAAVSFIGTSCWAEILATQSSLVDVRMIENLHLIMGIPTCFILTFVDGTRDRIVEMLTPIPTNLTGIMGKIA